MLESSQYSMQQLTKITAAEGNPEWISLPASLRRHAVSARPISVGQRVSAEPRVASAQVSATLPSAPKFQKLLAGAGISVVLFVLGSVIYFALRYLV